MEPDLFKYLSGFMSNYLTNERGLSRNTIQSYRDTFLLLLEFLKSEKKERVDKMPLSKITRETVTEFLSWMERTRSCSLSTRNTRLAAIHSFCRYLQFESIEHLNETQRILSIKSKKSHPKPFEYLTKDGIRLLLKQPNHMTNEGLRDLTMLSFMYGAGLRVQELIDMTPSKLRLDKPPIAEIVGKGKKHRTIRLPKNLSSRLKEYLMKSRMDQPETSSQPLFQNFRKEKFTRAGVNFILHKYCDAARKESSSLIPKKISCHSLRHSIAIHLLATPKWDLVGIRDFLGHTSIKTTEIYARVVFDQKRKAMEMAYIKVTSKERRLWKSDPDIIAMLKNLPV